MKNPNPATAIYNGGWTYALEHDLHQVLVAAEEAEHSIPFHITNKSENGLKDTGSFYTPLDVASYFWMEYFVFSGIRDRKSATEFANNFHFIEPAAGAGILVFALMQKLVKLGVEARTLARMDFTVIDINKNALEFIQGQFALLTRRWGVDFSNISFVNSDFRQASLESTAKPYMFFGNPPYVTNIRGESKWSNLYGDFLDISLDCMGPKGSLTYILPLSLAFSKEYELLRKKVVEFTRFISLSNFDNIPDALFNYGKPNHSNTNTANSQRCTILAVMPSAETKIQSTKLQKWHVRKREEVLSQSPTYYDITNLNFDGQFVRIENAQIRKYLAHSGQNLRLSKLVSDNGKHILNVASVARNYIGIREKGNGYVHQLKFKYKRDFYIALLVLTSDLFFAYWRSVGDGFHVTKSNISDFPINPSLYTMLASKLSAARRIWKSRQSFQKTKVNSGKQIVSYDFTEVTPSLLEFC